MWPLKSKAKSRDVKIVSVLAAGHLIIQLVNQSLLSAELYVCRDSSSSTQLGSLLIKWRGKETQDLSAGSPDLL